MNQVSIVSPEQLNDFDILLLDMNRTFMFGVDRFALEKDYFETYLRLGGESLQRPTVNRIVNGVYAMLNSLYGDPDCYNHFPTLSQTLQNVPETAKLPKREIECLAATFAEHEMGIVPESYVKCIKSLSERFDLYIVSDLWSDSSHWKNYLDEIGIAGCFTEMIFSSDHAAVKPSPKILAAVGLPDHRRVLMIGDSQTRDIGLAQSVEIQSLWISHGRTANPDLPIPDYIANDLLCLTSNPGKADAGIRFSDSLDDKQLQQLFDLYHNEWPKPGRTLDDIGRAVAGSSSIVACIEEGTGDLIGFCRVISDDGFRAWVLGLLVRPDYRGQGIGQQIMDQVLAFQRAKGIHSVGLTCLTELKPFYEKWGFAQRNEHFMDLQLRETI